MNLPLKAYRKGIEMITLNWIKCEDDWCPLETVNLANVDTAGIYIIWHRGDPARIVRIGQGDIAERLTAHRNDHDILAYKDKGSLRVTWASVPVHQRDGIERYLADTWNPLVGDAFPNAVPLAVNSPW